MKKFLTWLVNSVIYLILRILLKIEVTGLDQVPMHGPLIVASNHVNFLDAPVVITLLAPRPITGLVKRETWDKPVMAFLFNLWGGDSH